MRTLKLFLLALFAGFSSFSYAAEAPVDIFIAKRIITMTKPQTEATAVAVKDGRIVAVGSLDTIKSNLKNRPYRIDDRFRDKVLVPGLIDPHQHLLAAALTAMLPNVAYYDTPQPYGPAKKGVKTKEEVLARLKRFVAAEPDAEIPLIAWGYDPIAIGSHLTKGDLDQVSTTRPIIVWDASIHNIYVNSALLSLRGLTKKAAQQSGINLGSDGELNGQFLGNNAAHPVLFPYLKAYFSPEAVTALLQFGADLYQRGGITTVGELAFGGFNIDFEEGVLVPFFNAPTTPVRTIAVVHQRSYRAAKGDNAIRHALALQQQNTDKFRFSGVKFLSDDAFLSLTMRAHYLDGHEGLWLTDPDQLYHQMLPWWEAGFRIHVHSNGEESQDVVLDALNRLQEVYPRKNHRFTFEHFGLSTPAQVKRLKELGAQASVNPSYVRLRGEINEQHLGMERAHSASRLKTLIDAGVTTALHTDTPVAGPQPLMSVKTAVTRIGQSETALAPDLRVSLGEALKMVTVDAAKMLGMEREVGSIEAGKLADFTVLEQDPYKVELDQLHQIEIWGTVLGGKVFRPRTER